MSPEELQRIEEEERARAQIRAKIAAEEKAKNDGGLLKLGCGALMIFAVLFLLAMFFSSGGLDKSKEGKKIAFRGTIIETGRSDFSNRLWFRVAADGLDVKCYSDFPARERQLIHIAGTVTSWSSTGGSLDPCEVLGR